MKITYTAHTVNVALACIPVIQYIVLRLNTMRWVDIRTWVSRGDTIKLCGRKNPNVAQGHNQITWA